MRSSCQPSGVGDHRDGLGQPDVADRPAFDLAPELLSRQPGTDFLLKRQASGTGILNAFDSHRLDPLARHGQHDGQRVHHEARIDAGREHGDLRAPRHQIDPFRETCVASHRIAQLFGGRDDRHLRLEHRLYLRHDCAHGRRRAEHHDVGVGFLDGMPGVRINFHAQRPMQSCNLCDVAPHLGRIDIYSSDDAKPIARRELATDHEPDRTEAIQQVPGSQNEYTHWGLGIGD